MQRADLIKTASQLQPPPLRVAYEYDRVHEMLAAEVSRVLLERADLERLIGPDNRDMMQDNHRNHVRFMNSLFSVYVPDVFVETVLWVYRAYRAHGFHPDYWATMLNAFVEAGRRRLSPEAFESIRPFYDWLITNHKAFMSLSDEALASAQPSGRRP